MDEGIHLVDERVQRADGGVYVTAIHGRQCRIQFDLQRVSVCRQRDTGSHELQHNGLQNFYLLGWGRRECELRVGGSQVIPAPVKGEVRVRTGGVSPDVDLQAVSSEQETKKIQAGI